MARKTLRILVIDDDRNCLLSTARYLTLVGGHMVEVAENGGEGLKKAADIKPDIILLDMEMPGMTGLEVMDVLCGSGSTRDIPVIIVTGAALDHDGLADLEAKRNFLMLEQKPPDLERILKKIEAAARPAFAKTGQTGTASESFPEPA